VTRPDGSKWTYTIVSGALETFKPGEEQCGRDIPCPPPTHCQLTPYANTGTFVYAVGAPSGATGTFSFQYLRNYRIGVPLSCLDGNPDHEYPEVYTFFDNFSIVSKQITGPGLSGMIWSYDTGGIYGDQSGGAPGYFSATSPYDPNAEVYLPDGSCSDETAGKTVTVTGPTNVIRYTFGNTYGCDEGRLYDTEIDARNADGSAGPTLKTTTSAFVEEGAAAAEPFPTVAGGEQLANYVHPIGNRVRPVTSTQIVQDDASFTTDVNSFDVFARVTSETGHNSTGGWTRTTTTAYHDDLDKWVLGQTSSTSVLGTAVPCTSTTSSNTDLTTCTIYDSTTDLPLQGYAFGKLVSSKVWNADGTLHSVSDGNSHATTLSNWKRGLPQLVTYADSHTESAVVNDAAWITSVTDENGYTTNYDYDPMGRLSHITYPAGDSINWNDTSISFAPVDSAEFGIPAGHWKQTIQTGNGKTVTMFDALWRPLVKETLDTDNVVGTLSQTVHRYDGGGRTIFTSYPLSNTALNYASYDTGTHTSYDALDRVTEVDQDSELGTISSTTQYLPGFKTEVTDPRGHSTITSYVTFGTPDTSHPFSIAAPEGETTTISRDVFDKPLKLIRSGPYNGGTLTMTRYYVYDAHQQLCKRIDPESGSTVFAYDPAGNLQWSAAGLSLPSTTSCDTDSAYSSGWRVDRGYDTRNRVTSMTYADGYSNTSYSYAPDGALSSERVDNAGQPVTTTFTYDRRRLLTGETLSIPNVAPFSIGYGYDVNGHLSSSTYPDGRIVNYLPNALGQATQAGSYATGVSYYPNGGIHQFTYGNGIVHTMTQDTRELPDRSTDSYAGTAVLDDGYDYDADANVAAITDYLPGNVGNRTMTYDGLNRLTSVVSPMFGGDNKAVYTYDPLDNLRSARVGSISNFDYAYDLTNRLTNLLDPNSGSSITSFSYDVQGNLASKNGQIYLFDESNRLRSVNGVESYLYDAAGHRVQKTQTGSGTTIVADYNKAGTLMYRADPASAAATDYIYLGGSLIAQVTNNASQAIGNIDGVPTSGADASINGWACSTGMDQSINVELYVGGRAGSGGIRIGTYAANQPSEPAIASQCQASGTNYRYSIALDTATRAAYAGQPIYIYGDSPVGNNNNELTGSGQYTVPANPTPPDAPASVTVPASSATGSVTVSWTPSPNATSYVLQQSADGGATWTQIYSGSATQQLVSGLANGSYEYQVEACNDIGCSAYTTSGTLTVALPPPAPASISVPATSSTASVTVSWAAASTATSYVLQQSLNGGAWTQVYSGAATSKALSVGNGSYKYRVQACNASGCSAFTASGTLNVTIAPASITAPASVTTSSFTVSWSGVSGSTSYVLNQSFNGGAWTQVYSGSATSHAVSIGASGSYKYEVKACGNGGCSGYRVSGTVTATLPPAASHLSGPVSSTTGTFTLSWTAESGSTRYQLNQKLNSGSWTAVYNSTGLSWSSSHLASGTYYYVVYACNGSVCAPASNQVSVIVSPVPIPPAPVTAPKVVSTNTGFLVSWKAVSGATSYTLQQTNTDTGKVATKYTGSGTSTTVTVALTGFYQYAAKACNANGCSAWANATYVTDVTGGQ
jgi:YD repeat-containing protein